MAQDNVSNQSEVGYQNSPKEVRDNKGMPSGDKQFGKNKMPQGDNGITAKDAKRANPRHKEYR